jgi:hypothetical protein
VSRDANQIAQETARREQTGQGWTKGYPRNPNPRGTLTIWSSIHVMKRGLDWMIQSEDVTIDVSKQGAIIAYDVNNDVEIFYTVPGWYVNFVPDRDEGE